MNLKNLALVGLGALILAKASGGGTGAAQPSFKKGLGKYEGPQALIQTDEYIPTPFGMGTKTARPIAFPVAAVPFHRGGPFEYESIWAPMTGMPALFQVNIPGFASIFADVGKSFDVTGYGHFQVLESGLLQEVGSYLNPLWRGEIF